MTWAPEREHYRFLRRTHHLLLLRVIEYYRVCGTCRQLSYAHTLERTRWQIAEPPINGDGCSREPWPDYRTNDLRSGWCSQNLVGGGGVQEKGARSSTDWLKCRRDYLQRSEPQKALRMTTGGRSRLTASSGPHRRRGRGGSGSVRGCCRKRPGS